MSKRIPIIEANQLGTGFLIESDAGFISPEMNSFISEGFTYDKNKPTSLKCVLQKEGTLNKNQRVYPKHLLDREINKYKKYMKSNSAVGEADHPDSPVISLHNLSHRILDTYWDGNTLYGVIEILPSRGFLETGICSMVGDKILRYLELGIKIGISSRGVGSVNDVNGTKVVQEDYELICFDLCVTPSTPNAYLFQEQVTKIHENQISKNTFNELGFDDKKLFQVLKKIR